MVFSNTLPTTVLPMILCRDSRLEAVGFPTCRTKGIS